MYMIFPPHMSISDSRSKEKRLVVERHNLAVLHPRNPRLLSLLVLALVVSDDMAQVGLRTGRNVVRRAGIQHTEEK